MIKIKEMVDSYIDRLWKAKGQEFIETPTNVIAHFELRYKNLLIGALNLEAGVWYFNYSEDFKMQQEIAPLIGISDKNKLYKSKSLWPFFSYRISGLGQPQVQEIIKHEKIDPKDEVQLLSQFGRHYIANPFELLAT